MPNLNRLANPRIFPDGSISVEVETDGPTIDLHMDSHVGGEFVAYVCAALKAAAALHTPPLPPTESFGPISCDGIGFQQGETDATVQMVLNLSGFALAFEMPRSQLANMGHAALAAAATPSAS